MASTLELRSSGPARAVVHGAIRVTVSLRNRGPDPVAVPDLTRSARSPRFRIRPVDPPGDERGVTAEALVEGPPIEPRPVTLAPGAELRAERDLVHLAGVLPRGRYVILAEVALAGADEPLVAPALELEVTALPPAEAALQTRDASGRGDRYHLAWLATGELVYLEHELGRGRAQANNHLVVLGGVEGRAPPEVSAAHAPPGGRDPRWVVWVGPGGDTLEAARVGPTGVGRRPRPLRLELADARPVDRPSQGHLRQRLEARAGLEVWTRWLPGRALVWGRDSDGPALVGVRLGDEQGGEELSAGPRAPLPDGAAWVLALPLDAEEQLLAVLVERPDGGCLLERWSWPAAAAAPSAAGALLETPGPIVDVALIGGASAPAPGSSGAAPAPGPADGAAWAVALVADPQDTDALWVQPLRVTKTGVEPLERRRIPLAAPPYAPRLLAGPGGLPAYVWEVREDGAVVVQDEHGDVWDLPCEGDELFVGLTLDARGAPRLLRLSRTRGLVADPLDERTLRPRPREQ